MGSNRQKNNARVETGWRPWVRQYPVLTFCIASALWIAVLYHGSLGAPFLYDDLDQIANNPALDSWHAVTTQYLLNPAKLGSGFMAGGGSTYRPAFWILLALEKHLFGVDATGFHLTSLLLHWISGVLLFVVLHRLKMRLPFAALASLIWLGMPINSEAVAWISGQLYPLSTAFLLLALLLALRYFRSAGWGTLAAFLVAALLANLSHEQGVLLVVFLALGWLLLRDEAPPSRWTVLAASALTADAIYFAIRFAVGIRGSGGLHHPWNAGLIFWRYIQLILLPIHMSVERSTDLPVAAMNAASAAAWIALIVLILAVAAMLLRRRAITLAAALTIVLITVLPYCGFAHIYQGMAERYVYLASIGVALVLTVAIAAAASASRPTARKIAFTCLAIWIGWSAWRLMKRVDDWRDPIALYGHSVEATPQSVLMTLNYAAALQTVGRQTEAESQYRRVISLDPKDSTALVDLESLYIQEGRFDDAIAMYQRAVDANPNDANAYFNLGVMFQQRGQNQEALAFYKKVLQLKPDDEQTLLYISKLQRPAR